MILFKTTEEIVWDDKPFQIGSYVIFHEDMQHISDKSCFPTELHRIHDQDFEYFFGENECKIKKVFSDES